MARAPDCGVSGRAWELPGTGGKGCCGVAVTGFDGMIWICGLPGSPVTFRVTSVPRGKGALAFRSTVSFPMARRMTLSGPLSTTRAGTSVPGVRGSAAGAWRALAGTFRTEICPTISLPSGETSLGGHPEA